MSGSDTFWPHRLPPAHPDPAQGEHGDLAAALRARPHLGAREPVRSISVRAAIQPIIDLERFTRVQQYNFCSSFFASNFYFSISLIVPTIGGCYGQAEKYQVFQGNSIVTPERPCKRNVAPSKSNRLPLHFRPSFHQDAIPPTVYKHKVESELSQVISNQRFLLRIAGNACIISASPD